MGSNAYVIIDIIGGSYQMNLRREVAVIQKKSRIRVLKRFQLLYDNY